MPRRTPTGGANSPTPTNADAAVDLAAIAEVLKQYDPQSNLITVLQELQARIGYLPEAVVNELARLSGVPTSRIFGIITFYAQFSTEPSGRHKICVCHGTACHVAGAARVTEALEQELGVSDGHTTPDGEFTLDSVACMGACSQAPVMRIDDETFGNLTPEAARGVIRGIMARLGVDPGDLAATDGDPAAEKGVALGE